MTSQSLQTRNIVQNHALARYLAPSTLTGFTLAGLAPHQRNEVPMAVREEHQIVETPTEARQAEPGPSVLALLLVSTGLAVLILGVLWFVFFRT
jgi:hypothetical protein